MEYKVTIIVPVYNAERYINKCIKSILSQTLDLIELILLDDGSVDQCGKICDAIAEKNNNIKVLHLENGGPSRARNKGIKIAKGKYIGFVDADDYIDPQMYEKLYECAENNQSDMVICRYSIDDGEKITPVEINYEAVYNGKEQIKNDLISLYSKRYHEGLYSVCNKLFSNNLLQTNHIQFNENLIRAEDAWFVFDYLKVSNKINYLKKAFYYYRQVPTSTMHTIQKDRYERSKEFREKVLKECTNIGIEIDANELYYEYLYEVFVYCRSMITHKEIELVRSILDDSFFYEACKYRKYLPKHLKMLTFLERMKLKNIIVIFLIIWSYR